MSDQGRAIPDAVLTPEDLIKTVQTAVEGVDDLYAALPHPLARHHLKREEVKDFIALVAVSHAELTDRYERLLAQSPVAVVESETTTTEVVAPADDSDVEAPTPLPAEFVNERVAGLLRSADYYTIESVDAASDEELLAIDGIGPSYLEDIRLELLALTDEAIDDE